MVASSGRRRTRPDGVPRHDRPAGRVHAAASFAENFFERRRTGVHAEVPSTRRSLPPVRRIACVCSTDALYTDHAAEVAAQLEAAGARAVYLAGQATGRDRSARSTPASTSAPRSPTCSTCWRCHDPRLLDGPAPRRGLAATPHDAAGRRAVGDARGHRRASRSTPPPTSTASTSSPRSPASSRTCAARTRRCTSTSRGRSASTPASRRPRSPTPSTAATSPPARRACRWRSTWPRTVATTATTPASRATSAWPAWPSTRSSTCASCSTTSRSTR